jgi:UDP-glucuronate 4-epimerase
MMAHTYSSLYNLPTTGLRFFSVYGPWGRPDMALFLFTDKIVRGEEIQIFNNGDMSRDFTYVDDIVENLFRLVKLPAPMGDTEWSGTDPDPSSSYCPYKIFNIGNNSPVQLMKFVDIIEEKIGKKAIKKFMPMQKGDVKVNYADVSDLIAFTGFEPNTDIEVGVTRFVEWYKDFYNID